MFRYDPTYNPEAAVVDVIVSNPFNSGIGSVNGRGKLDSGGCRTIIPESWSNRLGLVPTRTQNASGFNGSTAQIFMAIVTIEFNGLTFRNVEVGIARRFDACIGRDILNQLKVELDGRNLQFGIV